MFFSPAFLLPYVIWRAWLDLLLGPFAKPADQVLDQVEETVEAAANPIQTESLPV